MDRSRDRRERDLHMTEKERGCRSKGRIEEEKTVYTRKTAQGGDRPPGHRGSPFPHGRESGAGASKRGGEEAGSSGSADRLKQRQHKKGLKGKKLSEETFHDLGRRRRRDFGGRIFARGGVVVGGEEK